MFQAGDKVHFIAKANKSPIKVFTLQATNNPDYPLAIVTGADCWVFRADGRMTTSDKNPAICHATPASATRILKQMFGYRAGLMGVFA
ncbi:hypothetical protein ACFBZI_11570 [Moraxella sp. ZJ142]|uniref:hypothetical protein n=1 Tax=Moraxella marmotae TaxID=3344520 RepID=UPI0035D4CD7B